MVALAFFLITLFLKILFRGLVRQNFSPADVLISIPAVALLLAKELVHYFVAGKSEPAGSSQRPLDFVRPCWEIIRDWFPFLVILMMYYSLWGDATLLLVPEVATRCSSPSTSGFSVFKPAWFCSESSLRGSRIGWNLHTSTTS